MSTPRPDRRKGTPEPTTGRKPVPRCPREAGEACRRLLGQPIRSSYEEIAWVELVARCISADVQRRGLVLDRRDVKTVIAMSDSIKLGVE